MAPHPLRHLLIVLTTLLGIGPLAASEVTLGEFSATSRSFRLVEGSIYGRGCVVCVDPREGAVGIRGQFWLRPGGGSANCPELLAVDLALSSTDPDRPALVARGRGTYRLLGSPDTAHHILQQMRLELRVEGGETVQLESGIVPLGLPLPWIDISLTEVLPPGPVPAEFVRLRLVAASFPRLGFSTTRGFSGVALENREAGEGDLLSPTGEVIARGTELVSFLNVLPVNPDLGLDAVRLVLDPGYADVAGFPVPIILFSTRRPAFSERLGPLRGDDLLSTRDGVLLRRNDWLRPFLPVPADSDPGLDAFSRLPDGRFLLSTSEGFFSEKLQSAVTSGDLLTSEGEVFRRESALLRPFLPTGVERGPGVDAIFVWPHGEIWFSTERDFESPELGVVGHGDLLSSLGRVVLRNRELLEAFEVAGDTEDYGLDALSVDSGAQFDDCGTLEQGVECVLFHADSGSRYVIFDAGGFTPGDRVRVTGRLVSPCTTTCQQGDGCLLGNTIEPCGLDACGTLIEEDSGCVVFETEGGARYLLEDTGGFVPGDRVRVTGAVAPGCSSECLDPCVEVVDSEVTMCFYENCGQLVDLGDGCIVLETTSGDRYAVENTGGFQAGDTVLASGILSNVCASPCIGQVELKGCIQDNDVDTAGPVGEVGFFRRADCNADGHADISDAIYSLVYLFTGGESPLCPEACNTNGDSQMDLSDGIYFLNYLFTGGTPPPFPYPGCSEEWIHVYCGGEPCPCFYPQALCGE